MTRQPVHGLKRPAPSMTLGRLSFSLALMAVLVTSTLAAGAAETIGTVTLDSPGVEAAASDERMALPTVPRPIAGCRTRVQAIAALVDNDSFAGQRRDGGYTSGVRIEAPGGPGSVRTGADAWVELALTGGLDVVCAPSRGGFADRSLFLVQEIYTPKLITETSPQPDDRPWAGMISIGRGWESVGLRGPSLVARRLELAVSVVGDASLGRQSQRVAHRWISGDEPLGWDNQLRNRWGVSASYLERQRWPVAPAAHWPLDVISHWGVTLGQIVTQARAGAMLRMGDHGCTFASPGLVSQPIALGGSAAPGCSAASGVTGDGGPAGHHQFAFIGFDVRGVARNELIEGEPRRGGNRANAETWVADLRIGYAVGDRDWTLSYALIRRSSEFKSANGSRCCGETYAAISLALTW